MSSTTTPLLSLLRATVEVPIHGTIFADVGLSLWPGEIVTIVGESGAGKTTLLRCLAHLEPLCVGELLFEGRAIPDSSVPWFRSRVLYVSQVPGLYAMTVEESLRMPFSFRQVAGEYDRNRAQKLLDQMALPANILERQVGDLSAGQAQRVHILRALLLDPAVLLLDEPLARLDAGNRVAVQHILSQWCTAQRALCVATHNPNWWETMATRRLKLRTGGPIVSIDQTPPGEVAR